MDGYSQRDRGGHRRGRRKRPAAREERSSRRAGGSDRSRRDRRVSRSSTAHSRDHPEAPHNFACHICSRNHWTADCPKLERHPAEYPLMDRRRGCLRCGQRGHSHSECRKSKFHCKECGGMHDTKDCVYDHVGEVWHEFVDAATKHAFYTSADESEVQWLPPTHELDTVLWYCPTCRVLNPSAHDECLKCHGGRPASLLSPGETEDEESETSSSSGDSDDSESDGDSIVSASPI